MLRRRRLPEWFPTVAGVSLSLLMGVFFYFKTDLKQAFATFAGLLGITVALQLEQLLQNRRAVAEEIRRDRLIARIEATSWLSRHLEENLRLLEGIPLYQSPIADIFAQRVHGDLNDRLRDLQRGYLSEAKLSERWTFEYLTQNVRHKILATSASLELGWWDTDDGKDYLEDQKQAIQRGAKIERIFIYNKWTPAHEEVANAQSEIGIEVLTVHQKYVNDGRDLIIWDDAVSYEGKYNALGQSTGFQFWFVDNEVDRLTRKYKQIKRVAKPGTPPVEPAATAAL